MLALYCSTEMLTLFHQVARYDWPQRWPDVFSQLVQVDCVLLPGCNRLTTWQGIQSGDAMMCWRSLQVGTPLTLGFHL